MSSGFLDILLPANVKRSSLLSGLSKCFGKRVVKFAIDVLFQLATRAAQLISIDDLNAVPDPKRRRDCAVDDERCAENIPSFESRLKV